MPLHVSGRERVVVVELTVDRAGKQAGLRIAQGVEDALDAGVLAMVGRFRYQPGLLNGKPFPITVIIHYVVPVVAVY